MSSTTKYKPERGKIVVVPNIPNCDFCPTPTPGMYDFASIFHGAWGHGCEQHWMEFRAFPELGVGTGQLWITEDQVERESFEDAIENAGPMTIGAVLRHKRERGA